MGRRGPQSGPEGRLDSYIITAKRRTIPPSRSRSLINRVNAEVQKIFADPAFREKNLELQAFDPIVTSPDRFSEYIKTDALKWGKVVRDAKVKLD